MGLQHVIKRAIAATALAALATACSHSGGAVQEAGHPDFARRAAHRVRAVVALPTLLGLSVDALDQRLGAPQRVPDAVQALLSQLPNVDPVDSLRFFRYRGLDVLVSYDARTRRPNDMLLLGSNEDVLMQRAGLVAEAVNYLLLPVFYARRPTQLLGLRVVPVSPDQLTTKSPR